VNTFVFRVKPSVCIFVDKMRAFLSNTRITCNEYKSRFFEVSLQLNKLSAHATPDLQPQCRQSFCQRMTTELLCNRKKGRHQDYAEVICRKQMERRHSWHKFF